MASLYRKLLPAIIALMAAAAAVQAQDMTRDEWTADRMKNLPAVCCQEGRYYRDCFEVGPEACENAVMTAVASCIDTKSEELPENFGADLSRKWDDILEKCVNEEYSEMYIHQKKETPECGEK